MGNRQMKLYGDKVYGVKVSNYGLENGYLDYLTLSKIVGAFILNNTLFQETYPEDWELLNGDYCNEDGYEYDIYQFYIISEYGYEFLRDHTDEIVYYNNELDIHLWGITHFGTSWDYVLTDIKLVKED
jgi:hypothetical protein